MTRSRVRVRWPGLRGYLAFCGVGVGASIALTFALRAAGGAAGVGAILVCTVEVVPEPDFPGVLLTWAVEPVALFLVLAGALGYVLAFGHVRAGPQRHVATTRRLLLYLAGVALVVMTIFGPLAAYSNAFLTAHMAQHFLLITIAPPLLLAGAPLTIGLVAAGQQRRDRWLYPVLHARWFHRFTHPVVGLVLFAAIPLGWYITPAFERALTDPWLHHLGHLLFLFSGIHYWWPVVGQNPSRWHLSYPVRMAYLVALIPLHAFLGSYFYEPSQVMFEDLGALPRAWGPSPLLDQQIAGAMMFIIGEIVGLLAILIVAFRWASADDRAARRFDARQRQVSGRG
jgi:putative copper resistance protein D